MEAWFLSDIHLKSLEERNGEILLRFLHFLNEKKNNSEVHLFLLGDIFDFWVSDHSVFVKKYEPLLNELKQFRESGGHLYYFEGNHDLHLDNYWGKILGANVFEGIEYFKLGRLTVRCEHGDLINDKDIAYLRLRKFVRHSSIEFLGHNLPGRFWNWLGDKLSHTSAKNSRTYRSEHENIMRTMIRQHAEKSFRDRPFDYIISGHMHVFDEHKILSSEEKSISINLGSWLTDEVKVLKITEEGYEWIRLPIHK